MKGENLRGGELQKKHGSQQRERNTEVWRQGKKRMQWGGKVVSENNLKKKGLEGKKGDTEQNIWYLGKKVGRQKRENMKDETKKKKIKWKITFTAE